MDGYPTKEPCGICGSTDDCITEPRFGYVVCRRHQSVAPSNYAQTALDYKEGKAAYEYFFNQWQEIKAPFHMTPWKEQEAWIATSKHMKGL